MKIELGTTRPKVLEENWPGQFNLYSWMDYVISLPQPLFIITTYKENRIPNACLHAWGSFMGEGENYYCIMSLMRYGHTYKNIKQNKAWCINFPSFRIKEESLATIKHNDDATDEITNSGLTLEEAQTVPAPRIKECFLNLECEWEWEKEFFEGSHWLLVCGKVQHIAVSEEMASVGSEGRYGLNGPIFYMHGPTNPVDGKQHDCCFGKVEILP